MYKWPSDSNRYDTLDDSAAKLYYDSITIKVCSKKTVVLQNVNVNHFHCMLSAIRTSHQVVQNLTVTDNTELDRASWSWSTLNAPAT